MSKPIETISIDPLVKINEEIIELRRRMLEAQAERDRLREDRVKWPKVVCVSVSQGEWGESVITAFNATCGWCPKDNVAPNGFSHIAAQAWLYYEVTVTGAVRLIGARDQQCGAIGETDCAAGQERSKMFGKPIFDDAR